MELAALAQQGFVPSTAGAVRRLKTLEPPIDRANLVREIGGERGIRTLGRVSPTHAFQACSFNHSDISPHERIRQFIAIGRAALPAWDILSTTPISSRLQAIGASGLSRLPRVSQEEAT